MFTTYQLSPEAQRSFPDPVDGFVGLKMGYEGVVFAMGLELSLWWVA